MTDAPAVALADIVLALHALPGLVRERRLDRGLSVRAAAIESGVHFATFSRAERGVFGRDRGISLGCAVKLLRWLDRPASLPEEQP